MAREKKRYKKYRHQREKTNSRPQIGQTYTDYVKRTLVVESYHPGDPDGREIRGKVVGMRKDGTVYEDEYATSFAIWVDVWLHIDKPIPEHMMKT